MNTGSVPCSISGTLSKSLSSLRVLQKQIEYIVSAKDGHRTRVNELDFRQKILDDPTVRARDEHLVHSTQRRLG